MTLPASIPLRRDSPVTAGLGDGFDLSGLAAFGLLLTVAILAVALWRKRRIFRQTGEPPVAAGAASPWWRGLPKTKSERLTQLHSTRLTPKHSLHEVKWRGKRLLIGCADQAICLIAAEPIEIEGPLMAKIDPSLVTAPTGGSTP